MASKSVDTKTALRQLMKQEKQKKIDSPFAKYSNAGQLYCSLCNQQLTSETFWKAHVNGREHKQKLLELKSNIKQSNADAVFAKPFPPSPVTIESQRGIKRSHDVASSENYTIVGKPSGSISSSTITTTAAQLPADFFDSSSSKSQVNTDISSSIPAPNTVPLIANSSALPEGFFDNPEVDARMRKVEYVDKMEIEWDTFTREMKQQTNISDKLEASDDIERDVEREIKEADELITRWQKIEEMHDIKDSRFKVVKERSKQSVKQTKNKIDVDDDDDNNDEEDLEKELQSMYNWRQKRS